MSYNAIVSLAMNLWIIAFIIAIDLIEQLMFAITDSEILRSSGGNLFKSCFLDGALYLGIKPAISEGELDWITTPTTRAEINSGG